MSSSSEALGRVTELMMSGVPVSLMPPSQLWPRLHPLGLDNNFLFSQMAACVPERVQGVELKGFKVLSGSIFLPFLKMLPSPAMCFTDFLDPGQNGGWGWRVSPGCWENSP